MPKISVIVPVYNVEQYLQRCVDSILTQTFTDFELILVNDGSSDKCPQICDEYAKQDERIHVIHQKNGGVSAARNAALDWVFEHSDSEWISFIDSDDCVHSKMLEYLYQGVVEKQVLVSACAILKTESYVLFENEVEYNAVKLNALDFYTKNYLEGVVPWNKLYAKALFSEVRYPYGKLFEDGFLTHQILGNAKELAWINQKLYIYYQNSQSIMHSNYSIKRLDELECLEKQCEYFEKTSYETFYHQRILDLAKQYCVHHQNLKKMDNTYVIQQDIEKKLRKLIRKYKKELSFSIKSNPWEFEVAFPIRTKLYWRIHQIKEIICQKGILGLLNKVVEKILCRKN